MPPLPLYLSQEVLVSDRGEFAYRLGIAIGELFSIFSLLDSGEFAANAFALVIVRLQRKVCTNVHPVVDLFRIFNRIAMTIHDLRRVLRAAIQVHGTLIVSFIPFVIAVMERQLQGAGILKRISCHDLIAAILNCANRFLIGLRNHNTGRVLPAFLIGAKRCALSRRTKTDVSISIHFSLAIIIFLNWCGGYLQFSA